jgi:ATP-dependent helicase/nuclease subunit A
MGLTEQQAAAAYAVHSVAVTAGAGTGKTHMLAERYLYHLESGLLTAYNCRSNVH